nr:KIP1-like protein [Tanacetum cinerariifolium]
MVGVTSKSQSKHEDSQIRPESSVAENAKGFEQFVNENELQFLVTDAGFRAKSMEEELEAAEKKLSISRSTISQLKQDQADQNALLKRIDSHSKSIHDLQEKIANVMSIHEDETTELNTKLDECKCEMTQMAVMNRLKEDVWNIDVGKLKVQLVTREKSFKDLIKRLNVLKSEKESISAQVNTLEQEKYSKDELIKELETRLDSLQVVHAEVCSVVEDVEKVNNELMLKMAELKGKVAGSDKLFQKEHK